MIETFHPAEFIIDELTKREWTTARLVQQASGDGLDQIALDLYLCAQEPGVLMGGLVQTLSRGFDTSEDLWRNLDAAWREAPEAATYCEPPDSIFNEESRAAIASMSQKTGGEG